LKNVPVLTIVMHRYLPKHANTIRTYALTYVHDLAIFYININSSQLLKPLVVVHQVELPRPPQPIQANSSITERLQARAATLDSSSLLSNRARTAVNSR
jgi:hypothetical protein